VILLLPHPLIKKYLTTNLCSTSSMTGWSCMLMIQREDSQFAEH
jgi:hypothetical protein